MALVSLALQPVNGWLHQWMAASTADASAAWPLAALPAPWGSRASWELAARGRGGWTVVSVPMKSDCASSGHGISYFTPGQESSWGVSKGMSAPDSASLSTRGKQVSLAPGHNGTVQSQPRGFPD